MASPIFRLSTGPTAVGAWTPGAWDTSIDSAKELFIRVDLQSSAGVSALAVSIPSADPVTLAEGVPIVTVDQATLTGVFQLPHTAMIDNTFRSLNVQVTINQGLTNGVTDASLTRSLQVNVLSGGGSRAFAVGESDQFHRAYGHTQKFNALALVTPSSNTVVYEGACTTTAGTPTKTVVTIPAPIANCVVQFTIRINGYDTTDDVCTTYASATAWFPVGIGAWTLDPAGILELHGYADDPAWAFNWATGAGVITFTVTGDAANDTDFNARVDAFYLYP